MAQPAIQVQNLSKNYGPVVAVDDIDFDVAPGEIVGFLGPNGAGKTTTLRILTSYLPATSGVARVAGFDVMNDSNEVRRRIGYLPESVPLYTEMRVEEYLSYRAKIKGVNRTDRPKRIDMALDSCRIREVRRRLIGTLSRGYRQRVGLADAMVHAPEILILDEPTSGLDPVQIEETLKTIKNLAPKQTVLFSHHILSEVEKICERVIVINQGRIAWDDKLSSFAEKAPALLIEVKGPEKEVEEWLKKRDQVQKMSSKSLAEGWTEYKLTLKPNTDPRADLVRDVAQAGWGVRRVEMRRQSLEDLFMNVVFRGSAKAS